MDFTTSGLYASIRRRASIPTTATTGGANADLLAYVQEELRLGLVAEILKLRESYFKRDLDTAISGTVYRIPTRALGGKLAGVYLLDSAGNVLGEPLPEIQDERQASGAVGYRVRGQSLVLLPDANTTAATLRQTYYEQPNEVVATGYATVLTINTSTNVVTTVASHGFTTSSVLDLVKATEGFESVAIDQTPTAASGSSLTFASLPSGLAVGDYVCVARQAPVPQIPSEFHPILAQRVACAWLEAGGYTEGLKAAQAKLQVMESAIGVLSAPRVDTGAKKLIARHSLLGSIPGRSRWGG